MMKRATIQVIVISLAIKTMLCDQSFEVYKEQLESVIYFSKGKQDRPKIFVFWIRSELFSSLCSHFLMAPTKLHPCASPQSIRAPAKIGIALQSRSG